MGSIVSIPTAISVALITTGIVYGFFQKRGPPPDWAAPSNRAVLPGEIVILPEQKEKETKEKKTVDKKSKKKKAVTAQVQSASQPEVEPTVVSFPAVVPGAFDQPEGTDEGKAKAKPKPKKKKAKKTKAGATAADDDAQSDSSATAPESSTPVPPRPAAKRKNTPVLENDGPWTRVEPRKRRVEAAVADGAAPLERTTSDAGVTTSVTGTSSSVAEKTEDEQSVERAPESRRPLAERLLPRARKTGVEDMVETPDAPTLARVMRVQPRADEQPAAGFSWADYEDVDESRGTADDADGEDEGGWVVKSSRSRPKTTKPSQPQQSAPETMTKKQRQNLARNAAEKAAKADAEAQRLATLAQHQRQLERVRIAEQLAQSKKKSGGGMNAVVDAKGHLVFE